MAAALWRPPDPALSGPPALPAGLAGAGGGAGRSGRRPGPSDPAGGRGGPSMPGPGPGRLAAGSGVAGKAARGAVVEDGFEHEGLRYKSLSAVARAITGVRWNGPRFFGLRAAAETA